MDITYLVTSPL